MDEKMADNWEDIEFKKGGYRLLNSKPIIDKSIPTFMKSYTKQDSEHLSPLFQIANIDETLHLDMFEEIVQELADNSSGYFMDIIGVDEPITSPNMTVDLIENSFNLDHSKIIDRFQLGAYIENKHLKSLY